MHEIAGNIQISSHHLPIIYSYAIVLLFICAGADEMETCK